jgi:hypothetical protein
VKVLSKILRAVGVGDRNLPPQFRDRLADAEVWRDRFGQDFGIADRMLLIFCDAFMFTAEDRFKFRPEDTVSAVYRALYPSRGVPDALEDTFLIRGLEKEFGFTFDEARPEEIKSFEQIMAEIKNAQRGAASNGGPAMPSAGSGVTGGPPLVS